jgi:ubiquinone/menaquinone biosynthesis C-methylase UbiE
VTASDREHLADYWENQGRRAVTSEHDAVCYPGAPAFLNAYVDHSQRRAVERLLGRVGSVAGARAIDVGCGTGRWSRLLSARGADVLAVDRSASMLEVAAQQTAGVEFVRMEATSLALPADAMALAIQVTVVQHLPPADQLAAIREIVRVVRPGGSVISIDVVGQADGFNESHKTYPRARSEWIELWRRAGARAEVSFGQDLGYPLALLRLLRKASSEATEGEPRASGLGWRRAVLRGLVLGSYATDWAGSYVPGLPGTHVAALYRVS